MLLILVDDLRMGRPTSDGKMCAGKLAPLKPHLTNCNNRKPIYMISSAQST